MREMTKILLSACTVCALGQGNIARAQSGQTPGPTPASQPTPTPDTPPGTSPSGASDGQPTPPDDQPTETPTPTTPAVPDTSQPPPPSPPDTTSSTTTTTTTTTSTSPDGTTTAPAPVPVTEPGTQSDTDMFAFEWHNPHLSSGMGISTTLGGGVVQFTNSTMRGTTSDIGGLWDLHLTFGSHLPLALDLAYVGTATSISGLRTGNSATLLGTAAEGTLRWNVLPNYAWTPYVFGGVGYQRYDVTGGDVTLSDSGMNSSDNLLSVPAGLGFVWRGNNGLVADVHGTYRFTWFQDLLLKNGAPITGTSSSDFVKLNNWQASAAIGYEF
jgi:hypothetical protein